jgi:hypothetical protein
MNQNFKFINEDHPSIEELARELKEGKPIYTEIKWIQKNIKYGQAEILDLEEKLKEPVGLRRDYEVLGTGEGECLEQSFLLISLLRKKGLDAKVALVCRDKDLLEKYYALLGDYEEGLPHPFDHAVVAVPTGNNYLFLDLRGTRKHLRYYAWAILSDEEVNHYFYNERKMGILPRLQTEWVPLTSFTEGHLDFEPISVESPYTKKPVFYLRVNDINWMLLSKWDLERNMEVESKYFKKGRDEIKYVSKSEIPITTLEWLDQAKEESKVFASKIQKKLGRWKPEFTCRYIM